jgi:hypothetical protein
MTVTEKLGQIWTAAVAYVALVAGAGLSIIFNVVDVITVRGAEVDQWDILTAVAFPVLVVLMVEMFVSRLWIGQGWAMQVLRWAGTVAIGGIAMRVSWTHGHDFFLARHQAHDVANLGPIAVDLLAIMATALILSGRSKGAAKKAGAALSSLLAGTAETVDTVVTGQDAAKYVAITLPDNGPAVDLDKTQDLATEAEGFTAQDSDWLSGLGARLGDVASTPAVPVIPGEPAPRVRKPRTDSELDIVVDGLLAAGVARPKIEKDVAAHYGVSTRTVRRRIFALSDWAATADEDPQS